MWIDAHAHLNDTRLESDLEEILARAQAAGIEAIVNIATDADELEKGLALQKKYPWIYQTAATTPHDVEKEGEGFFEQVAFHARAGHLVAIGETGLDYHYEHSSRKVQAEHLRRYLALAKECHLPVVIHCREAFADFFSIIDEVYVGGKGVLHCFTGTAEEAMGLIERGWYISFSGILTFKGSIELQAVAKSVPLERVVIETDAPYLAPLPFRGKQNEPGYLVETAKCLARLVELPLDKLAHQIKKNTHALFGIN